MLVLAAAAFGLSFSIYGLLLFPFFLVLFLFGIALGIFGSAVVLRLGPASEWIIWPIPGLLSPFAGVFYPISTLPEWMRGFSYVLPPSYVFEGMRATISGGAVSVGALLWAGLLATIYLLAACRFFVRIHRYAVRTGLFARYSAETLS
jgi:ABC-2 type transport system permease protein